MGFPMSEVKDALLEEFRVVVEREGNAKESVRTFAYNVLPKLLPTMPDDFVSFLLNVLNAGFNFYSPIDLNTLEWLGYLPRVRGNCEHTGSLPRGKTEP